MSTFGKKVAIFTLGAQNPFWQPVMAVPCVELDFPNEGEECICYGFCSTFVGTEALSLLKWDTILDAIKILGPCTHSKLSRSPPKTCSVSKVGF